MADRFGPALRPAEIEMLLKGALNKNTERATTAWLRGRYLPGKRSVWPRAQLKRSLSVLLVGSTPEDWSGV